MAKRKKTKNRSSNKKSSPSQKFISKLINSVDSIGFSKKTIKLIYTFKYENSYEELIKFYKSLPRPYLKLINDILFPKKLEYLNLGNFGFYEKNFEKNFNGMAAYFEIHKEKINQFIKLKKNFENNFLLSKFDKAFIDLESSKDNISYSNWYIYNSFLYKEYTGGFNENFSFLKYLLYDGAKHPLNSIFSFTFSRMVEKDFTLTNHLNYVKTEYKDYNLNSSSLKSFIEIYIEPFNIYYETDYFGIFKGEEGSSIIDKYLTFKKLLISLLSKEDDTCLYIISKLQNKIKDQQLDTLHLYLKKDLTQIKNLDEMNTIYKILDVYTKGNYLECSKLSKQYLETNIINIDIIEIYLKSCINLEIEYSVITEEESVLNLILSNVNNILKKNKLMLESLNNILNISYSLHYFDISVQLIYFINKTLKTNDYILYKKIYQIYTPTITPKIIHEFKNIELREELLSELSKKTKYQHTIDFFKSLISYEKGNEINAKDIEIPKIRFLLYKTDIEIKKKNYKNIINDIEPILNETLSYPHIHEECLIRLYKSYSKISEVKKCIDLYVNSYFINKYLLENIDTIDEIEYITKNGYKELEININLIIYLHTCKANFKITSLVYRMFMRILNEGKPSALNPKNFETFKLIYFLRYICTQDVLSKDVLNFRTVKDVDLERVKILQVLVSLDEENSSIYNDEIIDITQNIKIKERMREVDNSKIYVDKNGLINFELKDFEKTFSRFKKVKDLSDKSFDDFYTIILDNSNNFEEQDNYQKKYLTHESQLSKIFLELFIEIRNKYLFSNEHGLDSYLSTRIRHGTITGQLRRIFSELKLITTKNSDTGIYLDNEIWTDGLNKEKKNELNKILSNFSKNIDDYITYIKNSFIQIKTEESNSEALFDFSYNSYFNSHILNHYLHNFIKEIETAEDFIKYSIDICEFILDNNLESIKRTFNQNIKVHFINLIDSLEKDVNEKDNRSNLLNHIRKSRTDIQNTIELVSSWFERKKKKDVDFVIKDVIDTSEEIIKYIFSNIQLNIKSNIEHNQKIEGKYFISFVDCFKIFLENIIKYVIEKNNIIADVYILINDSEDFIFCKIENELINPTIHEIEEIDKKINEKIIEINDPFKSSALRTEDNTGLVKASKIIKTSLNRKNVLEFYRNENTIIVEMKVLKEGIINENIDC